MKIKITGKNIIISAESIEEKSQIKMLVDKNNNLIFQLQSNGELIELVNLGEKEDACNLAINVMYSSENETIKKISNLGRTPFLMDNIEYESVEGFWQGLKYEENKRIEIQKLFGKEAKKIGSREKYKKFVHYKNQKIRVGSREHWDLMHRACENKFNQNEDAQKALLSTQGYDLYIISQGKIVKPSPVQ